jgi:hypothetical protein
MTIRTDTLAVVECVETLAEDLARAAPDCADKAMRIVELIQDLKAQPDRVAVQDAIEATILPDEVSEARVHVTTSAVMSAVAGREDI